MFAARANLALLFQYHLLRWSVGSGALITDRHVVTAAHCFDTNGDSILDPELFIFPSEILFEIDGDWTIVDYDPAKVQWLWKEHGSDIAVVILEEDAPLGAGVTRAYSAATERIRGHPGELQRDSAYLVRTD